MDSTTETSKATDNKKALLSNLKGIGPQRLQSFAAVGITTTEELLRYFPFRYEDRRNFKKISQIDSDEPVLIKGKVIRVNLKKIPFFKARKVRAIFEAAISDGTQNAHCIWFNQTYLAQYIRMGEEIIIYGKPQRDGLFVRFNSPYYERAGKDTSLDLGRIVGIYSLTQGLTQKLLRKTVFSAWLQTKDSLPDYLPKEVREKENIFELGCALELMHFPQSFEDIQAARRRFIFEELFFSQIQVHLRKARRKEQKTITLVPGGKFLEKLKSSLPFALTDEQTQAINEMLFDFSQSFPMRRLLQGDVGCGKTVIAAFGLGACAACKHQAALMAPTEVLARQHKDTLEEIFKGFGFKIELLVSSLPRAAVNKIYENLSLGKIDIVVGTHALLQESVVFKSLGFVAIDEQHKFGVAQRAMLPKKGKPMPHCLVMSATPIPRSLALSLYGDLDLSMVKQLPPGRVAAKNRLLAQNRRQDVYSFLRKKIDEGRQAYIVYPAIEETMEDDLNALESAYDKITQEFNGYTVAMLHGRMKNDEKNKVMHNFVTGKINILMATTIIEVGVNVPNATVMIVENPERFGLSQLHQLRGRICRAGFEPYFILMGKDNFSEKVNARLKVIVENSDGFAIAEHDLNLRGPGDFFGLSQHGLPDLQLACPLRDVEALARARHWAQTIVESDPALEKPEYLTIRQRLTAWFKPQ